MVRIAPQPGGDALKRVGQDKVSEEDLEYAAQHTIDVLKAGPRFKDIHSAVYSYDPEPNLPLIQAPTLVLDGVTSGPHSPYTGRAREVKPLIPRSTLAIPEGDDTWVIHVKAKELAESISHFLENPTS